MFEEYEAIKLLNLLDSLNSYLLLPCLIDQVCTLHRVSFALSGIAFSQVGKEGIVARELSQIFTARFKAHG